LTDEIAAIAPLRQLSYRIITFRAEIVGLAQMEAVSGQIWTQ
jgi:hypothetical protein